MPQAPPSAGRSAQEEFQRRSARDAAERAHRRWLKVAIVIATPIAAYLLVRLCGPIVADRVIDQVTSTSAGDQVPHEETDPSAFHVPALLLAAMATVAAGRAFFGRRQTTEAWAKGAAGERATASTLAGLPDGYVVLHDLPIPRSSANIDHVVIGPTGVITVETKHYSHDVVIRGGKARTGTWPLDKVVAQATGQAETVARLLDIPVTPLVAIQRANIDVGWFGKPMVGGIRFTSNRRLLANITDRPVVMTAEEVGEAVATVGARMSRRPAQDPAPRQSSPEGQEGAG